MQHKNKQNSLVSSCNTLQHLKIVDLSMIILIIIIHLLAYNLIIVKQTIQHANIWHATG